MRLRLSIGSEGLGQTPHAEEAVAGLGADVDIETKRWLQNAENNLVYYRGGRFGREYFVNVRVNFQRNFS
jgi:hypothetical protein